MKKQIIISLFLFATALLLFHGCDEEEGEKNKEPTCSITNPASGISIPQDTTIIISAEADDEDGNLKEVRFYIDSSDIGSASSLPYNYEWSPGDVSTGTHTLKAEAIDEEGASAGDEIQLTVNEAGDAPVAGFEADQTTITEGETVNFTDQSTNNPTSWSWDFGDGNTSSEENPSHTYSSAGTYTVELTVENNYGSDTEKKTDYISVGSAPTADFSAGQTEVQPGNSVQFTDESTESPTSWSWDFGDGNTSSEQNPSHTYSSAGTYTVELTVENDYGSDTETKTDYINVSVPAIDFNGTTLYVYPEDNATDLIEWGGYGTEITDGNGADSDTDGEANTSAIVSQLGSDGHAAYLCDTLSAYGYNDWYLPAKSELNALYQNKDAIGGFSFVHYWSSTEYGAGSAWSQYFGSGDQLYRHKDYGNRVRCVRRD
jgi:PKD repeat protein